MFNKIAYWFTGLFTCRVYAACKMTGRNRKDMIKRAKYLTQVFKKAGVEVISPVLRERVQARRGVLKNMSKLRLFKKWKQDKDILAWECHGMVFDQAQDKSFGAERELGITRYLWWKPLALIVANKSLTVADFEDDLISGDEESVAHYFREKHGTLYRRWKWRTGVLNKSLLKFLGGQLWQWLH